MRIAMVRTSHPKARYRVLTKEQLRLWTTLRSLSLEGLQIRLLTMSEARFRFLLASRLSRSQRHHCRVDIALICSHGFRGSRAFSPPVVNARQIASIYRRSRRKLPRPPRLLFRATRKVVTFTLQCRALLRQSRSDNSRSRIIPAFPTITESI